MAKPPKEPTRGVLLETCGATLWRMRKGRYVEPRVADFAGLHGETVHLVRGYGGKLCLRCLQAIGVYRDMLSGLYKAPARHIACGVSVDT